MPSVNAAKQSDTLCHSEPRPEPFGGVYTECIEVLRVNSGEGVVRNLNKLLRRCGDHDHVYAQ
jgi:hypothetical protein